MRLLSYLRDGHRHHGRLTDDGTGVVELGRGDLVELLETEQVAAAAGADGPAFGLGEITIGAPLVRPGKILAVAANYASHVKESGGTPLVAERALPRLFLKPRTAILGPYDTLELPTVSEQTDWEVELGVVIGTRCRNVSEGDALSVIAGYVTSNDISARSLTTDKDLDEEHRRPFFDWLMGKWPDGFAPLGPWFVSADEVDDPHDLELHLAVNGEVRQHGSTSELIFGIAELISFASSFMTLEPGDVLQTGTPSGVGATTGTFLAPGDLMLARVGDLGEQRTPVRAAG